MRPCRERSLVVSLASPHAARLQAPEGLEELRSSFARWGAQVVDRCEPLGLLRLEVSSGEDLSSACLRLGALSEVRNAEPDWLGEGGGVPDDPLYPSQWHLSQPSGHDIDAPEAWTRTEGSDQVVVAILDTGILPDHPEFTGRVLPGMDFVNNDDDPTADHPHGIYTAGLLAANANNTFQGSGVDHHCKILPVKILDRYNEGTNWSLIQGLVFAADHGARVISMSLVNYTESQALTDALRYAREGGRSGGRGAVLVACGGNGGEGDADLTWPGASPLCITVGVTTIDDQRAIFSGTGLALDVVAPGKDLLTAPMDPTSTVPVKFSGCSASTPLVAGIAALLLSIDPSLTPDEVQQLIQGGAEDEVGLFDDPPGWDPSYGWGRVNAHRSLELLTTRFIRGDSNSDGLVDISDPLFFLNYLFLGGQPFLCRDAGDVNDDGILDTVDITTLFRILFLSGSLPPPFPACGYDTTRDHLDCEKGCQ
jgi:thermitase